MLAGGAEGSSEIEMPPTTTGRAGGQEGRPAPAWMTAGATLPKLLAIDPIGREWFALADAAPEGNRWDQDEVERALKRALATLRATRGTLGGREAFGHHWPSVLREIEGAPAEGPGASAAQIFEMREVLGWIGEYMQGPKSNRYARQQGVLQVWLLCQLTGRSFESAMSRRSIKIATGKRWRWQATTLIATGLMRDGIPVA